MQDKNVRIDIQNITKIYPGKSGRVVANDNISLSIGGGEIVGLLGHNGAGKTTLVNQILGLTMPTSGTITVLGETITARPERGRFLCSGQPQSQLSLGELSPMRAVSIMGLIRGGSIKEIQSEAMRLFEALDMVAWIDKDCNQLSGGIKRLTAFCMAVIHTRQIIILDEPTNGFQISLWVIPAYLLCTLTCIGVGYGFAYLMPPMIAMAFAQVLGFVVLMFSPINFPMDRLPIWLQAVHHVLPIDAIAKIRPEKYIKMIRSKVMGLL